MKARVFVTLKNGVLDPQGKAIHHALEGLGFGGVNDVRAGKMIELGRRYNVPTPVNQQLFETIRQIEASYLSKTG